MSKKKQDNPYVSSSVCAERHLNLDRRMTSMESDIREIKMILAGDREHPGLAQDMRDLKRTASTWFGVIRPIIIAIVTAAVTYGIARWLG